MKVWKAVVLAVCGLIAEGSIATGIIDLVQQKEAERIAKAERRTLHRPHGPYEKYFKRPLDFAFSSTALIVLSPLMVKAIIKQEGISSETSATMEEFMGDEVTV